jgi:hypothetical protein
LAVCVPGVEKPRAHANRELLRFYILRRRIEDIWVDIQRITEESPDEAEIAKLHDWILLGIEEIRALATN